VCRRHWGPIAKPNTLFSNSSNSSNPAPHRRLLHVDRDVGCELKAMRKPQFCLRWTLGRRLHLHPTRESRRVDRGLTLILSLFEVRVWGHLVGVVATTTTCWGLFTAGLPTTLLRKRQKAAESIANRNAFKGHTCCISMVRNATFAPCDRSSHSIMSTAVCPV
jgi:hypothetical protein